MKKYHVLIEETISEEFELDAVSEEDAIFKAIDAYKSGKFVLNPGNIEHRQICINDYSECVKWIEF